MDKFHKSTWSISQNPSKFLYLSNIFQSIRRLENLAQMLLFMSGQLLRMARLYSGEVFQNLVRWYDYLNILILKWIFDIYVQVIHFVCFIKQGVSWEHIPSDQPLIDISCGPCGEVWAVGKNGSSCWRLGISAAKPTGTKFIKYHHEKHVSVITYLSPEIIQ